MPITAQPFRTIAHNGVVVPSQIGRRRDVFFAVPQYVAGNEQRTAFEPRIFAVPVDLEFRPDREQRDGRASM